MKLIEAGTGEIINGPSENGLVIIIGKFIFTPKGLIVKGDPTFEEGMDCGRSLRDFKQGLHFGIGDWLLFMEGRWPDLYPQAMSIFGFDYSTLATDKWVAKKIPISRRREVPFGYHREVAPLLPSQQDKILQGAEREQWNRETIRAKVRQIRNPEPKTRAKHIKGISICCDLLFSDDQSPLVQVDHSVRGSPVMNCAYYRPGWKSVNRLIQAVSSRIKEGWTCRPILTYGTIGWMVERR